MVSKADIENLAKLARLEISDDEAGLLQKDVSNILDFVGQVNGVSNEEGATLPVVRNVMREDAVRALHDPLLTTEEALRAQFPTRHRDFNVVRKIIQKDE